MSKNELNKKWVKSISENLHYIFVFMNHRWADSKDVHYMPSPKQIAKRITDLWRDVVEGSTMSTGGLSVSIDPDGDPEVSYSKDIKFSYNGGEPYAI